MYYKIQALQILDKLNGQLDFTSLEQFISDKGWKIVLCAGKEEYMEYACDLHVLKYLQGCNSFSYDGKLNKAIFMLSGKADNITLLREICHIMRNHKKTGNVIGANPLLRCRANTLTMEILNISDFSLRWYRRRKWFYAAFFVVLLLIFSIFLHGIAFQADTVSAPSSMPKVIETKETDGADQKVYITYSGKKYHQNGCIYLTDTAIVVSLEEAQRLGKSPCKSCLPQNNAK